MHPFRFGIQCRGPADGDGWRALARKVEDLGWSTLTIADHFDDALAPIPGLMAAADATPTLRVGTLVLANGYRHPVVVAKEAATLDVLTGGRFELGIGAGWIDGRLRGCRHPPRTGRGARRPPGRGAHRAQGPLGRRPVRLRRRALPHRRPRRPAPTLDRGRTAIGGGGPRVLRLAGREADVVALNVNLKAGVIDERAFPDGTPASTDRKVAWVREAAGARVDELELQVRVHLAMVTDDRRERWGISYLGMSADQLDAFAPVIARLAGT